MSKHIHLGKGTVRPYVYANLDLPDFVREVFGATEVARHAYPNGGFHIEEQIGDSIVVIEAAKSFHASSGVTKNSVYVYVENVDAAYARAMALGATSISAPENKPYKERACGVRDSFGNIWYIATYTG
jgi:PhnB protein